MENNKKKKLSRPALVLIIGIIIIAIPCIVFATILISSAMESNKPVIGSRFDDDLQNTITDTNKSSVKTAIQGLSGVESVEIDGTTTGQFVVLIDCQDSYTEDDVKQLAEDAYSKVIEVLPVSTYFTASDDNKNYDLSIHVFNRTSANDDYNSWSYVILTKNSNMELPTTQIVSSPLDQDLVNELTGVVEENPEEDTTDDGE